MQNIYCVQSFCGLIRPEPFHTGSSLCYIIYSTQPYWLSDALCHIRQAQAVFLPNVRTIIDNFHTVLINGDIMSVWFHINWLHCVPCCYRVQQWTRAWSHLSQTPHHQGLLSDSHRKSVLQEPSAWQTMSAVSWVLSAGLGKLMKQNTGKQ